MDIRFTVKTIVEFETDGKQVRLEYGNPDETCLPVDVYVDGKKKHIPDYLAPEKINHVQTNELLVLEVVQNHQLFGMLD